MEASDWPGENYPDSLYYVCVRVVNLDIQIIEPEGRVSTIYLLSSMPSSWLSTFQRTKGEIES